MRRPAPLNRRRALALFVAGPLAACQSFPAAQRLSPEDAATLERVQDYLNSVRTLRAQFGQTWPNGAVNHGTLWLERPGHLRLQYAAPSPLTMVAAEGTVLFYDASTQASTTVPVARTPLGILLADRIALSGGVTVTAVRRSPGQVQVSMVRTANPGQGSLTLLFTEPPLALRALRIIDAEGQVTDIRLFDLQPGVAIDPGLFRL